MGPGSTKVVLPGGYISVGGGREEEVDAGGFELAAVLVEGAGVGGEVFVGAELGGVDEDGGGDDVALRAGGGDEREMAGVERAHGGDEAESSAGGAEVAAGGVISAGMRCMSIVLIGESELR